MEEEVKYMIVKETVRWRFCSKCQGKGKTQHGKFFSVCSRCGGSCKEKITHRTEVSLQEAIAKLYSR